MTRPGALTQAIACTRLSTAGQSDGYGQPAQEAEMRLAAPAWGLQVVEVVHEVMSGATDLDKRPEVQEYYRRALATPGQAFIFPRVDRLGRLAELIIAIARQLIRLRARVYVVGFARALDENAPDWLTFQFKALMSEQEYRGILSNLAKGKFKKAQEGHWPEGKPPYGYVLSRNHLGRAILPEPDPAQRAVYERILALYESGIGAPTIAATLSREGVPVPRPGGQNRVSPGWDPKTILSILKNPGYLGSRAWVSAAGEVATVTYPALITSERWQAIQLSIVTRRTQRSPRTSFPSLFGGRLACALCGGAMTIQTYKARGKHTRDYGHYHCRARILRLVDGRGVTPCTHAKYHRVTDIDAAGWAALTEALTDPAALSAVLASQTDRPPDHAGRIAELKAQMSQAVARTLTLDLPEGVLESAIRPLQAELKRLEAQQGAPRTAPQSADVQAMAQRHAQLLAGRDTLEQRQEAVQIWNARLQLSPDGLASLSLRVIP